MTATAELLIYEGFPTDISGGYNSSDAFSESLNNSLIHSSHLGFVSGKAWGSGTTTIRPNSFSLSYPGGVGTPLDGAAGTRRLQTFWDGYKVARVRAGQLRAESLEHRAGF